MIDYSDFFSGFHLSQSIGKPCMTPVSFVKNTESYDVSFVTISQKIGLRQDYRIIRGLPMSHTSFTDRDTLTRTDTNGRA